jgi:hypothetical protein
MALVKGAASAKKAVSKGVGATPEYKKASAWLNQQIVRSDGSSFKIKRGIAIIDGEDQVLEALEKSERAYRQRCVDNGIEYVPRVIHLQATVQLVDTPQEIPDLFEDPEPSESA